MSSIAVFVTLIASGIIIFTEMAFGPYILAGIAAANAFFWWVESFYRREMEAIYALRWIQGFEPDGLVKRVAEKLMPKW